ncbi:hypothetical protein PGB90_005982 [Kerria lacca]
MCPSIFFSYFHDGLKTIELFGDYVANLSAKLQQVRQKQDEERRKLNELRQLLRSAPGLEKESSSSQYDLEDIAICSKKMCICK